MSKPLKVFLGGLPSDATVEDIRAELSKFGPISVSHCKGVWGGARGPIGVSHCIGVWEGASGPIGVSHCVGGGA